MVWLERFIKTDFLFNAIKMARRVIPEGYKCAKKQGFVDSSEVDKLLDTYCSECLKRRKCEINYSLREAKEDDYSFWSRAFVAVENDLERKVICNEFKAKSKE